MMFVIYRKVNLDVVKILINVLGCIEFDKSEFFIDVSCEGVSF